ETTCFARPLQAAVRSHPPPKSGVFFTSDFITPLHHGFEALAIACPFQHSINHVLDFGANATEAPNLMPSITRGAGSINLQDLIADELLALRASESVKMLNPMDFIDDLSQAHTAIINYYPRLKEAI